jgi:hypothetical protein
MYEGQQFNLHPFRQFESPWLISQLTNDFESIMLSYHIELTNSSIAIF